MNRLDILLPVHYPLWPMRPLALLLALLLSGGLLHAQEQERKLIDRVLQPDMTLGNAMQNMSYYSGGASGLDTTKSANVKEFDFIQKFTAKDFETKEFNSKSFWGGEMAFATKDAYVKTDSAADKVYATKDAAVKDARESGKDYYGSSKGYATAEAVEKGKTSQAHLEETYLGKDKMNMDQVRDLLNKNH